MADILTNLSPITIACLHGYCIGGGAVIPAACDFRIAGKSTSLTINEVSIGFNLTWHTIPAAIHLVGPARAEEMIILGHTYKAAQLLDYGYVNEMVDASREPIRVSDLTAVYGDPEEVGDWAERAADAD